MTSLELLKEIEAWLSFNTEPSKEELQKLRNDIKKHISEQLNIADVVRSVCSHEKTPIVNNEGNTIGRYCSTCEVFYNIKNVGLKC